jgi:hypothetical protein
VTVNTLPIATIIGSTTICHGSSTNLTANGGSSYVWSTGATTSSISVTPTANTNYSVTVTDVKGCSSHTSATVTVNPLPVALISGELKICSGTNTILTATGATTYIWSTGQTASAITVNPTVNTTYTVTVTNVQGCTASHSVTVMPKPRPSISLSGLDKICLGDTAFIVATGSSENSCPGAGSVTDPNVLAYWNLDSCSSYMTLGTHIDYSEFKPIINKGSCLGVNAGNVHRLPGNKHSCTPGPNGSVGMCIGSQSPCNPAILNYDQALRFQITISPESSGQITGLEFYEQAPENYQWIDGASGINNYPKKYLIRVSKNGKIIYYQDGINTKRVWTKESFDFNSNNNFKTLATATYLFELIPYCTVNNGATESIWDIDEIKIIGGCYHETSTEGISYVWSNGETSTSIKVAPTTNTKYSVTVTDCCGCTNVGMFEVKVANLVADLGEDRTINIGESLTLTPVITGQTICDPNVKENNPITYLWSTGATSSSITVSPASSSFYRVTVTDCNGCVDTESLSIHVNLGRSIISYPNPASDRINISSENVIDPSLKVKIYSSDGKSVVVQNPEIIFNSDRNVSIIIPDNIMDGMYYLEIKTPERTITEKVILFKK